MLPHLRGGQCPSPPEGVDGVLPHPRGGQCPSPEGLTLIKRQSSLPSEEVLQVGAQESEGPGGAHSLQASGGDPHPKEGMQESHQVD